MTDVTLERGMTKEKELADFISIKDELLSLLQPLDEEQMNRVPFPGSWTAAQVGEHLLKSYGVIELFKGRTSPTNRPVDEQAPGIDKVFLDFDRKMKSPDFIVPSEGPISRQMLLEDLRTRTDGIVAYVRDHDLSFTCLDFDVGFGILTGLEWIHFLSSHTKRHVRQLRNIVVHS